MHSCKLPALYCLSLSLIVSLNKRSRFAYSFWYALEVSWELFRVGVAHELLDGRLVELLWISTNQSNKYRILGFTRGP